MLDVFPICFWCQERSEKGFGSLGTGVTVCKPPFGCWQLNLGLLQEQVLLTTLYPTSVAINRSSLVVWWWTGWKR